MEEKVIIAGSGGQGIMLIGKILAQAALDCGRYVTWLPAYGAEVRGGTAYCMVVVSDAEIPSPFIEEADTLIAMNGISLEKFRPKLKRKGFAVLNSSLSDSHPANGPLFQAHPFTDIAAGLGDIRIANMVALGCYLARKRTVGIECVLDTLAKMAPKGKEGLVAINQKALLKGRELIK